MYVVEAGRACSFLYKVVKKDLPSHTTEGKGWWISEYEASLAYMSVRLARLQSA